MAERTSRGGRVMFAGPRLFRRWNLLPYGMWVTEDGRAVLFSRFYEPLYQKPRDGRWCEADPNEWVAGIKDQSYFYDDARPERAKTKAAEAVLAGLELPIP